MKSLFILAFALMAASAAQAQSVIFGAGYADYSSAEGEESGRSHQSSFGSIGKARTKVQSDRQLGWVLNSRHITGVGSTRHAEEFSLLETSIRRQPATFIHWAQPSTI